MRVLSQETLYSRLTFLLPAFLSMSKRAWERKLKRQMFTWLQKMLRIFYLCKSQMHQSEKQTCFKVDSIILFIHLTWMVTKQNIDLASSLFFFSFQNVPLGNTSGFVQWTYTHALVSYGWLTTYSLFSLNFSFEMQPNVKCHASIHKSSSQTAEQKLRFCAITL